MNDVARLGLEIDSSSAARAAVDLDKLPSAAHRAERGVEGVGRKATIMGGAVDRATVSIRGMFGAFAAGAAAAFSLNAITRTLGGFEQSMAAVQAITRANATEMAALRDIAKDLGASTEFSASQAADGLKFLGMAGFTATESVAAIPSVLNLATAAAMDLASAADITSNIMSGFGIQADNASAVADVLAAASSRANTNVSQLGQAMSTVAPIASALDISLADTASAIGVMSDAGIQGERAGTAMRGVLASLAGPTTAAQKALASLGLTVRDVDPATNDLATVLSRLRDAGLSTSDAMTIFGREAASGALVLVEAVDRVRGFGEELSNVTGEAQRMADTMRDNLGGDIQGLISSAEALIIALGESGLTGALRSGTQAITTLLRAVAENMDAVLRGAAGLAAFFAAQYVASMGAAAGATALLSGALRVLRLAIAGTGIGALVLLLTDVVFRMFDASNATDTFSSSVDDAASRGRSFAETMQVGAETVVSAFDWAASSIASFFLGAFAGIRDAFTIMMNTILDGLSAIPGVEVGDWKGNPTAGTEAFLQSQDATRTAYQTMLTNWRRFTQGEWMDRDLGQEDISSAWEQFNNGGGVPALSELPGGGNGGDGSGSGSASAKGNAYEQATKAVRDNIAAMEQQALTFGLSETAAARFNTAMDLLRAAQEAGIPVTDALVGEINGLANAYATAEEQARVLQEQQQLLDQAASRTASGLTDAFEGLIAGGKNFGDVINSLIRDLGRMFLNQGFQALLGGALGGFNPLGFLGGLFGGPSFDGGGYTGAGSRSGGLDGRGGFLAMMHPNETVIDHSRGQAANQNQKVEVTINVNGATGNAEVQRMVAEGVAQGMKTVERNFGNMQTEYQMRNG